MADNTADSIVIDPDEELQDANSFGFSIFSRVDEDAEGNAGNITLNAGSLGLFRGASLDTSTFGQGNAGNITVNVAENIVLDDQSSISSSVGDTGVGDGGSISLISSFLDISNGAFISTDTFGFGSSGNIEITTAESISIDGEGIDGFNSGIFSQVGFDGKGNGGTVSLFTSELNIFNGGRISVSNLGNGDGGNLLIDANQIRVSGNSESSFSSGLFSSVQVEGVGNAGDIEIITEELTLDQSAQINAGVFGEGNAGDILINASGDVILDQSNIFSQVSNSGIGNGGNIEILATNLSLFNGSRIVTSILGEGNAGDVNIDVLDTVEFIGTNDEGFSSGIFSNLAETGLGRTGDIAIESSNLFLLGGGIINNSISGAGEGGSIFVDANTVVVFGNSFQPSQTGLIANSTSNAEGNAGDVSINSTDITIANGATISVDSEGLGDAGEISLSTKNLSLFDNATITANTSSFGGSGANANIQVTELLQLKNNSSIIAESFGSSNGGNIAIDTRFLVAFPNEFTGDGSDIIARNLEGLGGSINVKVDKAFGTEIGLATPENNRNDIEASSTINFDGDLVFNVFDLGTISVPNLIESQQTVTQACRTNREALVQGGFSINGKGGVPPEPGLPLSSSEITVNGERNNRSSIPQPIETSQGKIQPARGIKVTESGGIILTAYRTNNSGERLPETKQNCS